MATFHPFSLNISGRLLQVDHPLVMGIINATPDSFFTGSRAETLLELQHKVEQHLIEGVDIIDVGACSTRPGSESVAEEVEIERLRTALKSIREVDSSVLISVDTFRSAVARIAVEEYGANIINDISGGEADKEMFSTVASLKVPYVLMHMRGTSADMQTLTDYPQGVAYSVIKELSSKVAELERMGVADIIIDPGFGFAKTLEQNYELASNLESVRDIFNKPLLVGVSRKSMLTRLLDIDADDALNATTALNMALLERGASILRVHDVKAARQTVTIYQSLYKN